MPFLNRQNSTRTNKRHDLAPQRVDEFLADALLSPLVATFPEKEKRSVLQNNLVKKLETYWPQLVGPILMTHTRPISIRQGELLVACDHAIFAQQIQMMQNKIISAARKECSLSLRKVRTVQQPNIWQNTITDNGKKGDIISKPVTMVLQDTPEELEKKKILEELLQEFRKTT